MKGISTIFLAVILLFSFCYFAHANNEKIDLAICNQNEACIQNMEIGRITETLSDINSDIAKISKSLGNLSRYYGIWKKCTESQDWAESQKEFVCEENKKMTEKITTIKAKLRTLQASQYPGIVTMASQKLAEIERDPRFTDLSSGRPCQQAEIFSKMYF